jgi:hypothetical protein
MEENGIVTCMVCKQEIDTENTPFEVFVDDINHELDFYHCLCYFEMEKYNGTLGQFILQ